MNKVITKNHIISSLTWKLMERIGTNGITFIVSIVLARILAPKEYGLISLITIFITIANVFVQSGFNTALIQKKGADEIDFSTVFYVSLLIAGFLYLILFFSSPYIANFYDEPQLTLLLRVLSITLIFGAINSIQNAIIAREMQFKKLFYSSLSSILVSGIIGIVMAYRGFGVWSLVWQQLSNQFFISVIMWFTVRWRPKFLFSLGRLRGLFSYGSKILISELLGTLYLDLRVVVIGKLYTSSTLGYYNRGKQFPSVIIANLDGSIQSVMLPVFSSHQDNRKRIKEMLRRSIVTSSFLVLPAMTGLAIIAEPLVKLMLTDKWLPCVPFLQIFCVVYAVIPMQKANLQAIKGLGYGDTILKLEIVKKIFGIIILCVTTFHGVYAIAFGELLSSLVSTAVNAYPNIKYINYGLKEQFKDVLPSLVLSTVMGAVLYNLRFLAMQAWLLLIVQILVGIILYFGLARIFKLECLDYLLNTLQGLFTKRKGKVA